MFPGTAAFAQSNAEIALGSENGNDQLLDVARDILLRVRHPEGLLLRALEHSLETLRTVGTFRCPRSRQFPNAELDEVTGGQLMDVISQSAYVNAGLLLQGGVDIFGIDMETYLEMIHRHRVNYVKSSVSFFRPCRTGCDFEIEATLEPYPDGSTSRIKIDESGRQTLGLVKMRFEGRQSPDTDLAAETLFTAQIVACCRCL